MGLQLIRVGNIIFNVEQLALAEYTPAGDDRPARLDLHFAVPNSIKFVFDTPVKIHPYCVYFEGDDAIKIWDCLANLDACEVVI